MGLLHAHIYWLLREGAASLANDEPWPAFPVAELVADPRSAGRHIATFPTTANEGARSFKDGEWGAYDRDLIVRPVASRADALRRVPAIVAQGEGFTDRENGHLGTSVALVGHATAVDCHSPSMPRLRRTPQFRGQPR